LGLTLHAGRVLSPGFAFGVLVCDTSRCHAGPGDQLVDLGDGGLVLVVGTEVSGFPGFGLLCDPRLRCFGWFPGGAMTL
jgi:hypothetical protein